MKKPSLKIDSAKIKAFCLEHGEKFVVAIAVAILVALVHFGVKPRNIARHPAL